MSIDYQALGAQVNAALPGVALGASVAYGELTLDIRADGIVEAVRFLRDDERCRFVCFIDLAGVDYPGRAQRFDVVVHLLSPYLNHRIRVKAAVAEGEAMPSLTGLFPAANWFEREAFDLFGIPFSGHPDLRRLLTDYGFEGHPLRKDFPLTGYVEVRYSEEEKRVVYEPVKLQQEFRNFDFLSPWEGGQEWPGADTGYALPGDEKATTE